MANGWGPLAGVCALLLLLAGIWPQRESHIASTTQTLVDPVTARYGNFKPEDASLKLVQVVFRHGARTPLNTIYSFHDVNWTHCRDHYQGVEVELHDENGGAQPPPILDPNMPEQPGGCRQGTLTEAGYQMAIDVGTWLRSRYVAAGGLTGGFLPDIDPETLQETAAAKATDPITASEVASSTSWSSSVGWNAAVATLRTTPYRRTVATLRGVLTGLWPQLSPPSEVNRGQAASQPVLPVGASLESLEIMYGNNNTCPLLGPLHEAMQRDLDAADARDSELPRLNRQVAEALGLDPDKAILWPKLYDHLAAMIADGAPMPVGATREVLDIIWAQAERHEAGIIAPSVDLCASLGPGDTDGDSARRRRCHEVLRLGIGMLVRRLLDNLEAHVAAHTRSSEAMAAAATATAPLSQLYLFSGHDSSLMPLLAVLGQPARAWPPFASHLVFELWQTTAAAAVPGDKKAAEVAAAARMGRRGGVTAESELSGLGSGSGSGHQDSEFWVRVLYNGAPLVVPDLSNAAGWAPMGLLRQRVLLPYAITPAEHTAVCSTVDISDLDAARAPSRPTSTDDIRAGEYDSISRKAAAAARARLLRHATL
ncbi:hypothetical protein VaNZ11_008850 [Volvox africanus]|uniref:Acid phosphatase n=1 Tax=Volvox africanus TaxID=51714 RepID=A0ABQ5S798_9CHLO|nr:hypothetical protein VaNZ11_008850 [Volvox africanus]